MRAAVLVTTLCLLAATPAMAKNGGVFDDCQSAAGQEGACIDHEIQDLARAINGVLTKEQAAALKEAEEAENCSHANLASTQADAAEDLAHCKITLMQNMIEPAGR